MGQSSKPKTGQHILIVDNDPLVRLGLADLVHAIRGVSVIDAVSSISETLTTLSRERPDLIITELALEHAQDGLELIRYIRMRYASVLIVVLSSYPADKYEKRAIECGANAFLNKRASTDDILLTLRHILDNETFLLPASGREKYPIH